MQELKNKCKDLINDLYGLSNFIDTNDISINRMFKTVVNEADEMYKMIEKKIKEDVEHEEIANIISARESTEYCTEEEMNELISDLLGESNENI